MLQAIGAICRTIDKAMNEMALIECERVFSAYRVPRLDQKLYVVTEADRSSTCVMLASEY
jgi:hypothetical protein